MTFLREFGYQTDILRGMPRYLSIQYLRGAAAMAVVLFHVTARTNQSIDVGAAGVDVFFIISGFIIWTVSARRQNSPAQFLLHRVIRIVPAYWFVTLMLVAAAAAAPSAFKNFKPVFSHVMLSLCFIPHQDANGLPFPVIASGWTLNIEMFFYALFAASLLLPPRLRYGVLTTALLVLAAYGVSMQPSGPVLNAYTDPLLLEFAIGLTLGVLAGRKILPGKWPSAALLAGGLAVLAAQAGLVQFDESLRLLCWGLPCAMIVTGAVSLEVSGRWRRVWGPLRLLGDCSYSIYLVHSIVVAAVYDRLAAGMPTWAAITVSVALCAAAGIALNKTVEAPGGRLVRGLLRSRGYRLA